MPDGLPPPMIVTQPAPKPWWQSRTLTANTIVLALATAESQLHLIQPLLPVNVYAALAFGLPLVNMALRAITQQPLSFSTANSGTPG